MSNNAEYCRSKAAPAGSNLHYALLFEPEAEKKALLSLFALHSEISSCLTVSGDPGVNRLKLQWWSEELERLSASGARHPVTISLLQSGPPVELLLPSLRPYLAAIGDITGARFQELSFDDWYTKLTTDLGQLWYATASRREQGLSIDAPLLVANGGNILLLELVQDSLPLLLRGYRLYPDSLLAEHQCTYADLPGMDGGTACIPLFRTLIDRIAGQLDTVYPRLSRPDQAGGWYVLILNRLAAATCAEIRHDGYQLLRHRIALTPLRKFWIALRTRYLG